MAEVQARWLSLLSRDEPCSALVRFKKDGTSRRSPSCRGGLRQRNNFRPLSFLGADSHGAAARIAEPKVLAFARGPPVAALMLTFNLCYEEPTFAQAEKLRRACGICAFIEHRRA